MVNSPKATSVSSEFEHVTYLCGPQFSNLKVRVMIEFSLQGYVRIKEIIHEGVFKTVGNAQLIVTWRVINALKIQDAGSPNP